MPAVTPSTGTGLDRFVQIIQTDKQLNAALSDAAIQKGAAAVDALNGLLVDAIRETGVLNDGDLFTSDIRTLANHIKTNDGAEWGKNYANFEVLLQTENNSIRLFDKKAISYVAERFYDIGFGGKDGRVFDEDGNVGTSFRQLDTWLEDLLAADIAAGKLTNPDLDFEVTPSTGTGLDLLVEIIQTDALIRRDIEIQDIAEGARIADRKNVILVEAIRKTDVADDGNITGWDVRDISDYITSNYKAEWKALHGSAAAVTGFHVLTKTGNNEIRLFDQKAVNYVADWIYHIGLGYNDKGQLFDGRGIPGNNVNRVADFLEGLLKDDLESGSLAKDSAVVPKPVTPPPSANDDVFLFQLIDAGDDRVIDGDLSNGVQGLTKADLAGPLAVAAISSEVTGKVKLELKGASGTFTKTEAFSPYAIFGDQGDDFFGQVLEAGNYTFSASTGGVTESVDFTLVA